MKACSKKHPQLLHATEPSLASARFYPNFLEDGENFACVLILPGGGYGHVSHQEGPPVAGWLNSMGISAVVLEYSVSSAEGADTYPRPQQQALFAMRWLRANAAKASNDLKSDTINHHMLRHGRPERYARSFESCLIR